MMYPQKIISTLLATTMSLSLTACTATTGDSTAPVGLEIAILTSPNSVNDGTFNEANYDGAMAFVASRGEVDTLVTIQESTGEAAAAVMMAEDWASEYDVMLCISYLFANIVDVAQENPDTAFVLVDAFPTDDFSNTVEVDNIYAMTFAEQESGFFAGVAAALETKTGKVAVVNGIAYPSNVNYQYGFESGVNYAVKNLGAQAQLVELEDYAGIDVTGTNVGGNYINDFVDTAKGQALGEALIEADVDIIFVAAGGAGDGVFSAVKESHADDMVIGCDVDQYDAGVNGTENIVLTSALKNMTINIERQLNAVADGTFVGENENLYADTDSTGYVSQTGRHQMSDETVAVLAELYPLVKDQTIQPAANFSGTTPENFPGL